MVKGRLIDRREFLGSGARVSAGAALFSIVPSVVLGKGDRPAPSNRITMGAIGVGGMGTGNLGSFLGNGDVQMVGAADVDSQNADRAVNMINGRYRTKDAKAYRDFRDLLARGDLDAISMATPDHWHAITATYAMRAGCDVYGEKPLSHCLAEGRVMADTCKRYGRVWQTGSWQRSVANFRFAVNLVRTGRIGKVVRAEVGLPTGSASGPVKWSDPPAYMDYDMWCGPSRYLPYCDKRTHWNWRWQLDFGGGQMMDWIGHHCDIAHWGLGMDETGPIEVEGKGNFPTEGIWDAATTYRYTAKYRTGEEFMIGNSGGALRSGCKWIGEDGHWVWVDRGGMDASPRDLLKTQFGPSEKLVYHSDNHHRNFLDCVKSRGVTITPAETAHRSASVGHLGLIAMQVGRKIRWNPDTEQILDDPGAAQMLSTPMRGQWHL